VGREKEKDKLKRLSQKSDFSFFFTAPTGESVDSVFICSPTTEAVGSNFVTSIEPTDLVVGA
jgi:hypothetical protein